MLSRISKMSVFGIVALMLAFGLVTTDALAQTAAPSVTIEATATTTAGGDIGDLRAADSATLTFTVDAEPHGTAEEQKPGQVRIIIPTQWSSPLETVGAVDEAREVSINTTGGDDDLAMTGSIIGRHLVVDIGKNATGEVTFVFMTVTPPTMRRHGFELKSTAHAIVDDADNDPPDDQDQIRKRGGRYYLDIDVGPIRSGASPDNNFTLSGGGALHLQPNPDEKPPPHAGMYLAFSNAPISNLRVSYKVPGTMPKDSTFIVTLVSAVDPDRADRNLWELSRKSDASPSSNIELTTDDAGAVLTGKLLSTLQSGTISFTLKRIKAPKVEGDAAAAINSGFSIQAQTSVFYDADGVGGIEPALETAAGPAAPFGFVFTKPDGTGRLRVHAAGTDAVADGNVVTHHVAGSDLGGLTIVLDNLIGIAGGSAYEIAFPQNMGWPEPYEPIGAAQDGALTGALTGPILPSELGADTVADDQTNVAITYQVDKASATQGPHVFNAKVSAGPHGNLKALGGHTIHMTADHGTGTVDLIDKSGSEFVRAIDAAAVDNLRFRYKPAGYMAPDAALQITLPDGWTRARTDNPGDGSDDPGEIAASSKARVDVADDNDSFTVIATEAWNLGDTIVITYKNVKVADITDGTTRSDTFAVASRSFGSGAFKALAASPIVGIGRDPDGSGSIALSVTETDTATAIGTLMITYTAAGKMEIGSVVEVTVPDTSNWPNPAIAANLSISNVSRASLTATAATETAPATMSATTSTELGKDDTIIFVYRNIGAQPAGTHTFSATSTVTYDGTPNPLITGTAEITVNPVVPGSVALTYVKDEMMHPLTNAAPGGDLGQLTFTFTAEAPMESGSQVQITVPSGWWPPFRGNTATDSRRGAVWVAGATVAISPSAEEAGPWTITATPDGGLAVGGTLAFTYNAGAAPSEGTYPFATMASVASGGTPVSIATSRTVIVRELVAAITITAEPTSVFVNEDINVTVALQDADGQPARALSATDIMLSDGEAGGSFSDADGNAVTSIPIDANASSASATYSNASDGMIALAATLGEMTDSADVEVKSTISNLQVNGMDAPLPLKGDATITVSAKGIGGADVRASVTVTKTETDADGNEIVSSVVSTKSLDEVPAAPDAPEDDVAYTRDIDLGGLVDGDYTVTVNIGDDSLSIEIAVLNNQEAPTLSDASATPVGGAAAIDEGEVVLSVTVTPNASMVPIALVEADVSELDSTRKDDPVALDDADGDGTYSVIFPISTDNAHDDGEVMVSFTATDSYDNESDALTASITLRNDYEAPVLTVEKDDLGLAKDGDMLTIVVESETGLTVTANAESVGGGMVMLTEGAADESNGDAANGNGNGMDANGNGNGNDMADAAMPAGNGVYTVMVTVTDAEDGEQTITITGHDDWPDNVSEPVSVTVMIDNTGAMLSDASADPTMATNDMDVIISVDADESGLTITANAESIGGGMVTLTEDTADESNGNGNGDAANGNGADMADSAMVYSYSGTATVTDAEDGEQTITITATDALGNESEAVMVSVTVDNTGPILSDANADPAEAVNGGMVTISVSSESGLTTVMAEASAIGGDAEEMLTEEMDADMAGTGTYSVDVEVTDAEDGEQTITITATDALGNESEAVMVSVTVTVIITEVEPSIQDLSVDNALVKQDSTITVSVTGKAGGGTVTVLDSEGETVVAAKALDPDGDPDEDGDQAYTRSITLPEVLADGTYTVNVEIQGEMDSSKFEVVNDQAPPTLSEASARPVQTTYATNGKEVVLSVTVELNDSNIEINSVTADVSALDSTLTGDDAKIELTELPTGSGRYTTILTISSENMHDDGEVMVSFIATDRLGNESEAATASIRLKNDVTAPELSMESAMPSSAANDMVVTISVSSEPGLTVTADATAIGGDAAVALDEGMDANGNGNGMDANGNGNGMDANGNGNGMNANGNGNGMNANGNGDDMTETAMPAGNGVYSGMVTVTAAEDGEQTITITATDGSGNASTATVSVTIDNTGAMLSDASADPTMATNDTEVILSVNGGESGLTVTADASAIGGGEVEFTEGMDDMYSATVTVTDAEDGEQMVTISATDALGNASEAVMVSVTVDNSGPTLSDASADPAEVENGDMVTISVMGGESGLTVMADASELGAEADVELAESSDTAGSYSGTVEVNADSAGDKMVSITATDALGNASEAVTVMVSVHEVTSVSFSPAQVSTGDTVTVTAMGTAGLTATFSVFDAEAMNIVDNKSLMESTDGGTYEGSFEIVADAHPTGEYYVSASVGKASMPAENTLTIDHKAQFTVSIAAGTHAIHVPLDVTHIDGEAGTIETVGDLYDALGESVNFIITLGADGNWTSYLGDMSAGSMADAAIGDDTGLIAVMKSAATLELTGNALGTGGVSQINIEIGNNLVGIPLDPVVDMMINGALVEGVGAIAVSNAAGDGFHTITAPGDTGDGPLMGGVGYIVVATAAANIPIVGSAWENEGAPMAAPGVAFSGSQTPVLHVDGAVMDEFNMLAQIPELRVTVRNLSTGASLDTVLGTEASTTAYSATFVEFGRHAAKAGDVLEIVAHSPNPYVGVRPVPQIVVSAEEVLTSRISLPDMELYEIPSESELLANYPNPFNPETWIPYRLAKAAEVTLDIYDTNGRLVRTIDIGFKPAAVYESRASAIYWDGRNNYGERVASGTYFYHLTAGDDYASTRRMVILK